jgi:hypothetical protein
MYVLRHVSKLNHLSFCNLAVSLVVTTRSPRIETFMAGSVTPTHMHRRAHTFHSIPKFTKFVFSGAARVS